MTVSDGHGRNLNRLAQTMAFALARRRFTKYDLAEELEVHDRTALRYCEALYANDFLETLHPIKHGTLTQWKAGPGLLQLGRRP